MSEPAFPLVDPEWIAAFHIGVKVLVNIARDLEACVVPRYRVQVLRDRWYPTLERLRGHLWKVAESLRDQPGPRIAVQVMNDDAVASGGVFEAFRMATVMMDDIADKSRANPDKTPIPVNMLARIEELLGRVVAAPGRPIAPESDRPAGTTELSGDPATPRPATPQATHTAKGTPGMPERRRGQPLTKAEKKEYLRIIRALKSLPHAMSRKKCNVATRLGIDIEIVVKADKWGRKHELL
jgi:hypothetical protein